MNPKIDLDYLQAQKSHAYSIKFSFAERVRQTSDSKKKEEEEEANLCYDEFWPTSMHEYITRSGDSGHLCAQFPYSYAELGKMKYSKKND